MFLHITGLYTPTRIITTTFCIQFFKHQKRNEDERKLWKLCLSLFFCFVLLVSNVVVIRNKKDLLMIFFVRKLKDHKKLSAAFLNRVIWHTQQAKRAHNFNILFYLNNLKKGNLSNVNYRNTYWVRSKIVFLLKLCFLLWENWKLMNLLENKDQE